MEANGVIALVAGLVSLVAVMFAVAGIVLLGAWVADLGEWVTFRRAFGVGVLYSVLRLVDVAVFRRRGYNAQGPDLSA